MPAGARKDDTSPSSSSAAAGDAPSSGVPAVRASDDERHQLVEWLGDHAAAGRISLSELEERVAKAYQATTRDDLTELTRDLPAEVERTPATAPTSRRSRWFFAIMGGSTRRGRQRLAGKVNAISIMGGDDIDLREVEFEGGELVINAVSIMGGATIYLPDSVEVELSGPVIMGGNDERGSTRPPRPGAPVIRIRCFTIMGGVDVWRLPPETRGLGLKEARRIAKAMARGAN